MFSVPLVCASLVDVFVGPKDEALSDLDGECVADVVLAPLNIDLYLSQRHELGMEPERITVALRRLFLDGLRAATRGGDARTV